MSCRSLSLSSGLRLGAHLLSSPYFTHHSLGTIKQQVLCLFWEKKKTRGEYKCLWSGHLTVPEGPIGLLSRSCHWRSLHYLELRRRCCCWNTNVKSWHGIIPTCGFMTVRKRTRIHIEGTDLKDSFSIARFRKRPIRTEYSSEANVNDS